MLVTTIFEYVALFQTFLYSRVKSYNLYLYVYVLLCNVFWREINIRIIIDHCALLLSSNLCLLYLLVVLVVEWLGAGLVIERSLVRLPAGPLSSQLGQLSLTSLRGR